MEGSVKDQHVRVRNRLMPYAPGTRVLAARSTTCMPHGCLVEAVSSCTVRTISKSLGCSCWGIRAAT